MKSQQVTCQSLGILLASFHP